MVIKKLDIGHAKEMADLHLNLAPWTSISKAGDAVLLELYRTLINSDNYIAFGAFENDVLQGTCSVSHDSMSTRKIARLTLLKNSKNKIRFREIPNFFILGIETLAIEFWVCRIKGIKHEWVGLMAKEKDRAITSLMLTKIAFEHFKCHKVQKFFGQTYQRNTQLREQRDKYSSLLSGRRILRLWKNDVHVYETNFLKI